MKSEKKAQHFFEHFLDESVPEKQRAKMLQMLLMDSTVDPVDVLKLLIKGIKSTTAKSLYEKKLDDLRELIQEMEAGPFRCAVFVSCETNQVTGIHTAQVHLDDGTPAYCAIPEPALAESLQKGDRILLDARGRAVLRSAPEPMKIGDEATYERSVFDGCIEITLRDQEKCVFFPSRELEEKISRGEVLPGDTLVVNSRQSLAFDVLPPASARSRFEYLLNEPVPDVIAARDIGSPPYIIENLSRHVRLEMVSPAIRRRFGLPRSSMNLLTGIPGTGKTLSIEAIWRDMYQVMSEVTGVPFEDLPPRVFRLRLSRVLSEWLGRSDKNIDRFFDEVEELASQKWEAPDGTEYELPVLVILEEIDGLAQARGGDTVYDRILTGVLQRLDPDRGIAEKFVLFIGTTNEPDKVDTAMLRRIGSSIEKLGRLSREGFITVLQKQIARLPVEHGVNGGAHDAVVRDLTGWLFSPNGSDNGVIELNYAGSTKPDKRFRRDFLTGALVNRAVRRASENAATEAYEGKNGSGIHLEHFVEALDFQVRSTADQISEHNAGKYVEIPDSARIVSIRRLPQPDLLPLQLQQ